MMGQHHSSPKRSSRWVGALGPLILLAIAGIAIYCVLTGKPRPW